MTEDVPHTGGIAPYPTCGPSSEKLMTDVANFMERADEVVEHPLAQHDPDFNVLFHFDPAAAVVRRVSLDLSNLDKATWLYLASVMRPIVFNQDDPISFANLTVAIGFEHAPLRGLLKTGRKEFIAWQKHMYVGQQHLGSVPEQLRGQPSGTLTALAFEEIADGVRAQPLSQPFNESEMVPDYVFADIYFNGKVWHSDTQKAAAYHKASPLMQAYYAKCAEIRTITAIRYVRDLRAFISAMRTHGHSI